MKAQTRKIGVAGEFFNQIMGNNATEPKVGEGATMLHYSDRSPYRVIEVSEDGRTAKIEAMDAVFNGKAGHAHEGHQNWRYEPTGNITTIVWRNGAWRIPYTEVRFLDSFLEGYERDNGERFYLYAQDEYFRSMVSDERGRLKVVDGVTKAHKKFQKISIIFGIMEKYHDWSF